MIEEYVPLFRAQARGFRKVCGHIYVILMVMIGFVFFRAENMQQGIVWVSRMFTGTRIDEDGARLVLSLLTPVHLTAFAAGIFASAPVVERMGQAARLQKILWPASLGVLLVCMMKLAGGTYNPFIYFRF